MSWRIITQVSGTIDLKKAIFDRQLYIEENNLSLGELCSMLGYKYFDPKLDFGLDEIMEMFNDMTFSRYSNNLVDFYLFMSFFFKRQLFNKRISIDEATLIYDNYFKYKDGKETEFVKNLTIFKDLEDSEQDSIYALILKYLTDLKIT